MHKTLQEALGFGPNKLSEIRSLVLKSGTHFPGHGVDYRSAVLYDGIVSFSIPQQGNADAASPISPPALSHQSTTYWHFVCEGAEKTDGFNAAEDRRHVMACPMFASSLAAPALPLRLLHPGVMGLMMPGDELAVQTTFIASEVKFRRAGKTRSDRYSIEPLPKGRSKKDPLLIRLRAPFAALGMRMTEELTTKAALDVLVPTPFGMIKLYYAFDTLPDLDLVKKAKNKADIVLEATGWLVANCATGYYKKGARHDLRNLLRIVACALSTRSWGLLSSVFSENTVLVQGGLAEAHGTREATAWLESHADWMHPKRNSLGLTGRHRYVWKHQKGAPLPGLGLEYGLDPKRTLLITAEAGVDNRISLLRLAYEDEESLESCSSFRDWARNAKAYDRADIKPASDEALRKAWASIDVKRIEKLTTLNGDFWLIDELKSPDFGLAGVLITDDEKGPEIIEKAFGEAKPAGQIENLILYETKGKPGFCFTLHVADPDSGKLPEVIEATPSLPGCRCPVNAEVLATYSSAFELVGALSVRLLPEHTPLTLCVPDLRLHRIVPHREVGLDLYAMALDVQIEQPHSVRIGHSELYESVLREALEKAPSTTRADYPFFDFDESGLCSLAPEGMVSVVTCRSVIESVTNVRLYGVPLVSFKIALQKGSEKIFVQVYANKGMLKKQKAKPGDIFLGPIFLMARLRHDILPSGF